VKKTLSILLSLGLGLFLVAGFVSLVDDSLVLLFGFHFLTVTSGILSSFAFLLVVVIYGLMGLTPMIPKRVFLPVILFYVAGLLVTLLILIYAYNRLLQFDWVLSFGQVILVLSLLWWLRRGSEFCRPIIEDKHLGNRRFGWWNLSGFVLVNIFGVLPAMVVYMALCAALAVNHFSEGFMALRPNGFTVQVRKYIRNDGKMIELIPMSHIGEADFYRKVSGSFPTNSIILMEGVTDRKGLITNEVSYKRAAKSLGLVEQEKAFEPSRGELVMADVDTEQFSTNTIGFLNLVMLFHSRGVNAGNILNAIQDSPTPGVLAGQVLDDLLRKRNQHLVEEIQSRLSQTDNIMVPWGVMHMPGIAGEIQKSGFRLYETREYTVIRFHVFRWLSQGN
jgi:hypothetical protein